jgi:hypothetical protein
MKNKQTPSSSLAQENGPRSQKASYSSPFLRVYGPVSKLTMGGGASQTDGVNTTKKVK